MTDPKIISGRAALAGPEPTSDATEVAKRARICLMVCDGLSTVALQKLARLDNQSRLEGLAVLARTLFLRLRGQRLGP